MASYSWKKRKVSWKDGDSGRFRDGTLFRLAGVRAPEKHQFGGNKAKNVASGMTGRTKNFVRVKTIAVDSYGRKVVQMKNKDGSINVRLRRKGYTNRGK